MFIGGVYFQRIADGIFNEKVATVTNSFRQAQKMIVLN